MKTMPAAITALIQELNPEGSWVWLIALVTANSTTVRYVGNTENVTYDGNVYTALSFGIDKFTQNAQGLLPEFTCEITNAGYVLQDYQDELVDGTVTFTLINTENLAADYSEDAMEFTIIGATILWANVSLTLGVAPEIRRRSPEDRLNPYHCRHRFQGSGRSSSRCGYVGKTITGITLPSGNPVQVTMSGGHNFETGDEVYFENVNGGCTGLNGNVYTCTYSSGTVITLDSTDGDDFTAWSSTGTCGYAYCDRNPDACNKRSQFPAYYGGPISMRREAVRYV